MLPLLLLGDDVLGCGGGGRGLAAHGSIASSTAATEISGAPNAFGRRGSCGTRSLAEFDEGDRADLILKADAGLGVAPRAINALAPQVLLARTRSRLPRGRTLSGTISTVITEPPQLELWCWALTSMTRSRGVARRGVTDPAPAPSAVAASATPSFDWQMLTLRPPRHPNSVLWLQ